MTTLLESPIPSVVDALRGERLARPRVDRTSAGGLRALLEDGIFDVMGTNRPASPLVIRAASLRQPPLTTDLAHSPLGRLRGVLVVELLRLLSVGVQVDDPFGDAISAWKSQTRSGELTEALARLDNEELARLATDVDAHFVTLRRALGVVPGRWLPRSTVRVSQRLGGGDVVVRDTVDLMFGTTTGKVASVTLLDVTSSPLGEGAERAMRYHALVQTLRTATVPLRTAAFSTATGELWIHDVDFDLLARSASEVIETIQVLWSSR
jgi:hypothetical protein